VRCGASLAAVGALVLGAGCVGRSSSPAPLTADVPLHLESHLAAAAIEGSAAPVDPPRPVEWRFDQPQPEWKAAAPFNSTVASPSLSRTEDALRVTFAANSTYPKTGNGTPGGGVAIDLPDWHRDDWAHVVVRARTAEKVSGVEIGFNPREGVAKPDVAPFPFRFRGERTPIIRDGSVQTYLLRADWSVGAGSDPPWQQLRSPWQRLGLWFVADEPASIDILSVSVIPKEADYTSAPVGSRSEARGRVYRSALYTHAPGKLAYRVRIPEGGRLDVGLGVLRTDAPVTFRVTAAPDAGETVRLFEERVADMERWTDRSIDLSSLAGRIVTLTLATDAERLGTVALWGAPTVRASRSSSSTTGALSGRPNVVFYVIDGGGADFMSVYGYHRRTTPTLERLASEGAVFERVYSNASWTRPSTASFMTGLQNSVMGGLRGGMTPTPVPEQAMTMAEHMHRAGYQTAVFTANPNAGTLGNLQRGVDLFREDWDDFTYAGDSRNHKESSRFLNEGFWKWRQEFPGEPYWAHFQSTDVHEEFPAVSPFAGLFVGPDDLRTWKEWNERLRPLGGHGDLYSDAWKKTGISRTAFFSIQQGLYDETMAHNDYQLGRLVDRLKATGAWDRTLLVVGADHSISAAMDDMGPALSETLPPPWGPSQQTPMFRPTVSRVPLIVVWPGHIRGGQRFAGPVSMIDVLPTLLDLVGLPPAEVSQGQSLAPLLRGTTGWQPRPVILDEFNVRPQTGKLGGMIEIVDGEWGASLEINPDPDRPKRFGRRPVPLLLYNLWKDPMCLQSVHEQHPDLVAKYTKMLTAQFEAHQALAQRFTGGRAAPLTPEQLRTLRSLGYIR
jgi:arylsulfatase A-like enzyme